MLSRFPPHDIAHISRIEEEVPKTSLEPKDDLAPVSLSEVQTLVKSLIPERHRASMMNSSAFAQPILVHSKSSALVEYVSEGFETERSTVAVFFDVAKAFDRSRSSSRLHLSSAVPAYTNDVPRPSSSGVQLALFADDTALFTEIGIGALDSPSSLQRAIDELGQWFRKWRIEVNPDKSAAIQVWWKIRVDSLSTKTLPILKCWMRSFRGNGTTNT
ncbi:hypothetical protein EVAR_7598_1 [Eumeta japonica]|uniref:Uncharacterized protein n=1 Tax=Eumeta variegata TaxID=151549 RepID=A0A4C1SBV2_EUMVA|nr:hypothetical protein EVAR_7598_1 [Eumeta japonica]